jgi:general secretion pathway protein G
MSIRRMNRKGFTLVEILIVVIILGILAAIVIPQFTNASQDARRSSLGAQLQTLRSQIEMYKLQHEDGLPDLISSWEQLTKKTDIEGNVGNTEGVHIFGPYIQSPMTNPLNRLSTIVQSTTTDGSVPHHEDGTVGFIYDYNGGDGTGKVWAPSKNVLGEWIIYGEEEALVAE